jgi:nitrate/TMAO reductase-like tetraheme cytochrome c subunit
MPEDEMKERGAWSHIIRGMWRSPLGLIGVMLTTVSATLMVLGLAVEVLGLTDNVYVSLLAFLVLPGGMITGLLLIPLSGFLRRRQWHKYGIAKDHLQINLSDHKHRKLLIWLVILTVMFFTLLTVIGYQAYELSDSPEFCGKVCHNVMIPEYTVYQRSPHAKVVCVECHIGSGVSWFVKAKISGMRQVWGVMTGSYDRPIPAPVESLRPARDTCEECHWPEKFSGKRIKQFIHYSDDDQENPTINNIALHIGGRNAATGKYEGIHWHVSQGVKIQYLADEKRHHVAKVKLTKADGSTDEFVNADVEVPEEAEWRTMDCIDCHNRPTHVYDLPEERVDFGLYSKKINGAIPGIREDSMTAITKEYNTRDEAKAQMTEDLMQLQVKRNGQAFANSHKEDIQKAGEYLLETYLGNVWPNMNIKWGTYGTHLGHQRAEEGWGCWRCHDDEHTNANGDSIPQDCNLCHDEPDE